MVTERLTVHCKPLEAIISDIGNFMLNHHCLTLKEQSKVKSDTIKRFAAYDFIKVGCTLQTSRSRLEPIISDIEIFMLKQDNQSKHNDHNYSDCPQS